jgi:hypothetical protein
MRDGTRHDNDDGDDDSAAAPQNPKAARSIVPPVPVVGMEDSRREWL